MSIKIEKTEVVGWEHAIRGMRNPKNSWDRIDSGHVCGDKKCSIVEGCDLDCDIPHFVVGENDHKLMMNLAAGGPVHAKYRRMIAVYCDITAPLFWWKEFDTYKVGTVRNSCSTMHKIHVKEFTYDDFAHEGIDEVAEDFEFVKEDTLKTIETLEWLRNKFNETQEKRFWRALIEKLPDGYQMKATMMLNYEVLAGIHPMRRNHKLDEWHDFCDWIESLPYSEIIIGDKKAEDEEELGITDEMVEWFQEHGTCSGCTYSIGDHLDQPCLDCIRIFGNVNGKDMFEYGDPDWEDK